MYDMFVFDRKSYEYLKRSRFGAGLIVGIALSIGSAIGVSVAKGKINNKKVAKKTVEFANKRNY